MRIFKLAGYSILVDTLFTPISLMLGHLGFDVAWHFFKLPFFILYLATLLAYKVDYKLDRALIIFLFLFIFSLFNGLINNGLNKYTISHVYFASLAFFGYAFGLQLSRRINFDDLDLSRYIKYGYILFAICIAYFMLYITGVIQYFGISTNIGYFALIYYAISQYKSFVVMLLGVLVTGKRTVLLGVVGAVLSYYRTTKIFNLLMLTISIIVLLLVFANLGLLDRLILPIESIIEDEDSARAFYSLTSGRNFEVEYALNLFNNIFNYFLGLGYGVYYEMPLGLDDNTDVYYQHYTHFSPVSFAMLYGWVVTSVFYIWMYKISVNIGNNKFKYLFAYTILASFAGATLLVDSKVWIIIGYFSGVAFTKKNSK